MCQYRSVFELKICKKIIEFYGYFGLFLFFFKATIHYGCELKSDRQQTNAIKTQNWRNSNKKNALNRFKYALFLLKIKTN